MRKTFVSPLLAFANDALFFHKICILNQLIFKNCCINFNIIQQNACCSIFVIHNAPNNLVQWIINCNTFLFCMSYVQIAINQTPFPQTSEFQVCIEFGCGSWAVQKWKCVCVYVKEEFEISSASPEETWTPGHWDVQCSHP